jgi:hypothetical protein
MVSLVPSRLVVRAALGLLLMATLAACALQPVGALEITVEGLPAEVAATVRVVGPGVDRTVEVLGTATVEGLPTATYEVEPQLVVADSDTYAAESQTVEVTALLTKAVIIEYQVALVVLDR